MKVVTVLLEMSPVTSMFTFLQSCLQGLTDALVYPLDLNIVYPNENADWKQLNVTKSAVTA